MDAREKISELLEDEEKLLAIVNTEINFYQSTKEIYSKEKYENKISNLLKRKNLHEENIYIYKNILSKFLKEN